MANPEHLAKLKEGIQAWNTWRWHYLGIEVNLSEADLRGADLASANLAETNLTEAILYRAELKRANLKGANLAGARLNGASLYRAKLCGADLTFADLRRANLRRANLFEAKLSKADMRDTNLQNAKLNKCVANDVLLWEAQRAGWSIKGIICERAFWDRDGKEPIIYSPREFERLYSDQTCIEFLYPGGVSTFELNTLPALLHHLASLHPGSNIRLKSVEETGGGAKISISVGDADPETTEEIRTDAKRVYEAQIALREQETERMKIEKDYLERLLIGKLIPAMLNAAAPQNVFNAPVTGVVISSGESKVDFHQAVNEYSAILALLEKLLDHRADLGLSATDTAKFESNIQSASAEFRKKDPDKSSLSKSIGFIQRLGAVAIEKAAGKLGEAAISANWHVWLDQLNQLMRHWK
jgi:uncharacterized protein YjbI with pentapeptide repeats